LTSLSNEVENDNEDSWRKEAEPGLAMGLKNQEHVLVLELMDPVRAEED
jgi:hypothetical protein